MAFNPFTLANISCNIILHPVLFVLFIPLFSPTAASVVGWWSRRQATTQELTHSLCLPPTTRVLVCVLSSSSSFYRSAEYAFTQQIESRERTKLEKFSRAAFFLSSHPHFLICPQKNSGNINSATRCKVHVSLSLLRSCTLVEDVTELVLIKRRLLLSSLLKLNANCHQIEWVWRTFGRVDIYYIFKLVNITGWKRGTAKVLCRICCTYTNKQRIAIIATL